MPYDAIETRLVKSELVLPVPRKGTIHAIDDSRRTFVIEDEIVCKQRVKERNTRKRICLQKIRFEDNQRVEYRFCYYMLGLKPGAKGRWVFGQYALMIPAKNLAYLLAEARKKKWEGV